ncbi:MAG: type VI secretion system accessory protein TagJ [Candidatus Thiothrix putei]|uniref:Type VI secretion system accessory protein TagJ n=1 Tax=Candidatus Thiothrix putei TaxID=3080811 RepID=A0AA95HEF1_9GAMM|nr:MAG: type VI secretion system accessory protein TagJ [Candidatus Thiothrix putei]
MKHENYLRAGKLAEALACLQDLIRDQPSLSKYRILLFQLLAVMGQWERALKQLDVIRGLDDSALAMVHLYRSAIACEMLREQVFQGQRVPVFMGKPDAWQALLLQALTLSAAGHSTEALAVREQAFAQAPASAGKVDGIAFEWLADADSRLGPTLEVIMEGGYRWVAFAHIQTLTLEKPVDLRDLVWLPAHIQWRAGGDSPVLIPTRYPGSANQADTLALARRTEWEEPAPGSFIGYGQRVLTTDTDDYPLLDVRFIEFLPEGKVHAD